MKVLVVEDHQALRKLVVGHLVRAGFVVDAAAHGRAARTLLGLSVYDAMILDLGLPDMDGMTLLQARNATANSGLPCLILTARDALESRLAGLNAGADDYILKPFEMAELEARLRAVLRRPGGRLDTLLRCGNLAFEPERRHMTVADHVVELARREAALLEELLRATPRVVIKDRLEERLYALDQPATSNAIEALVSRLRRKLTASGAHCRIETVRGLGYRLKETGAAPPQHDRDGCGI